MINQWPKIAQEKSRASGDETQTPSATLKGALYTYNSISSTEQTGAQIKSPAAFSLH